MSGGELVALAHAKVNLVLEVRGRRPDGYHELFTIFDELELADTLRYQDAPRWGMTLEGAASQVPAGDDNLVLRAANAFARRFGIAAAGHFVLTKRIPAGGGLGGGSSDAAAALRLLAQRHGVPRQDPAWMLLARELGADVAFFLVGGRAWASGRGDHIHSAPHGPGLSYVLLLPGYACPTAAVFDAYASALTRAKGHLDSPGTQAAEPGVNATRARERLSSLAHVDVHGSPRSGLFNDLDDAARQVVPALARLRQRLAAEDLPRLHLSGSGSTLFAALHDAAQAQTIAARIEQLVQMWSAEGFDGLGASPCVLVTHGRYRGPGTGAARGS